jgi:hypothetical protein
MLGNQGYAVVSCHVERPLDDRVWSLYASFVESRPGGFAVASLMRPPADGEGDAATFASRARTAARLGDLGHHTHWTSPTHARPVDGDPAATVRDEVAWFRAHELAPAFYCGGGWYMDLGVFTVVADAGYADCTATARSHPARPPVGMPRLQLDVPARVRLPDGRTVLELPTTHSAGAAAKALARSLPAVVHVHFHDYELLDPRRRRLLALTFRLLARRRRPVALSALTADSEVDWSDVCVG